MSSTNPWPVLRMTVIGITTSKSDDARQYQRMIEKAGGSSVLLRPGSGSAPDELLNSIDGLLLSGGGDIHPALYDYPLIEARPDIERDAFELPLTEAALNRDMPIFGICRGVEVINVAMGGKLLQQVEGHSTPEDMDKSVFHDVYIAPGSRLGAILGGGPVMRVNSQHHQGFTQALKAPGLMASAYVLKGDLIEGIEAPFYTWVLGVQWHPEIETEVHPKNINLFHALVEAAETRHAKIG